MGIRKIKWFLPLMNSTFENSVASPYCGNWQQDLTNPALQKQNVHFSKRHVLPFGQHIYTNIIYLFKNATLEHMILFFDHDRCYLCST